MALLKVLMRPDGVVEARGTQDVVAALRSGGEEQFIAATERPATGVGRAAVLAVPGRDQTGLRRSISLVLETARIGWQTLLQAVAREQAGGLGAVIWEL